MTNTLLHAQIILNHLLALRQKSAQISFFKASNKNKDDSKVIQCDFSSPVNKGDLEKGTYLDPQP